MRSRRIRLASLALLATLLLTAGCGPALEDAGLAIRGVEDAARAARAEEEIAAIVRTETVAAIQASLFRTAGRITSIVDAVAGNLSPELQEAAGALAWDVGCDIVTGNIPSTRDDVAYYLEMRAASFGLEFTGDAAPFGQALLEAMDAGGGNDASTACSHIREMGF